MFPAGVTHITNELAFERREGKIAYFNGHMPVFVHAEDDVATFRMITSQFCESGYAKQCDIIRAFGVTSISVKRAVKLYRERGTKGFYAPRRSRGPAVLTAGVMAEIESLLVAGVSLAEVAQQLCLKLNTTIGIRYRVRGERHPIALDFLQQFHHGDGRRCFS